MREVGNEDSRCCGCDGCQQEASAVRGALGQRQKAGPGAGDRAVAIVAGAVAGLDNGCGCEAGEEGEGGDELHGLWVSG